MKPNKLSSEALDEFAEWRRGVDKDDNTVPGTSVSVRQLYPMRRSGEERYRFVHQSGLPYPAIAGDECVAVLEKVGDDCVELLRTADEERVLA